MRRRDKPKVFNDPVHGHVELHPLAVAIVDTPQFQRLRDLLQVGPTYFVFPGASHRRFSHSIGVSYLAGKYVRILQETLKMNPRSRREQQITEIDALCVQIAGLCHDLGHGPFSHTYDGKFVRARRPDRNDWAHEHASADLLEHLIRENKNIQDMFESYGLGDHDVHFIKELIFGHPNEAPKGWVWRGRGSRGGRAKHFLYEIVANHRNGIDVDKFDYFARDSMHLGMTISFDASRLMKFARVLVDESNGESQIAYHEKEAWNIFELFHTRYNLHKRAYQHRVGRAVEAMITDALIFADDHINLASEEDEEQVIRMSQAFEKPATYTNLTDSILHVIEYEAKQKGAHEGLKSARNLLRRVKRRKLYSHIGEKLLDPREWGGKSNGVIKRTILSEVLRNVDEKANRIGLLQAGIYVDVVKINYGMGKKNPVDHIMFYLRSTDFDDGSQLEGRSLDPHQISCFVPHVFEELYARLYIKHLPEKDELMRTMLRSVARAAFEEWASSTKQGGAPVPMSPSRSKKKKRRIDATEPSA
eukprot:g2569.t1